MAMRITREDFVGAGEASELSYEEIAAKMALDFESSVFLRLKQLGLRRKDLAQLLGVSPAAVTKMLSADSNLTIKSMAKIAGALGCEVSPIQLEPVGVAQSAVIEGTLYPAEQRLSPTSS